MWICVQDGAREHYAIPRALKRSGRLGALFTEVWAGPVLRAAAFGPLKAMAGRYHKDLGVGRWMVDDSGQRAEIGRQKAEAVSHNPECGGRLPEIISWNWDTVWRQFALRIKSEAGNRKSETCGPYPGFIQDGRWFSEKVRDYLVRCGTNVRDNIVFSYDTTALELFRWAKERGALCVLGQIDPGRVETELVQEEENRWPGWALRPTDVPDEYFRRRDEEWKLADRIIVNSRWSHDALTQQGVPADKLAVMPLCYEGGRQQAEVRSLVGKAASEHASPRPSPQSGEGVDFQPSTERPLRVLFLGQVILRKGIQYLVEAAKLLQGERVHFDVVGTIGISDAAVKSAPANTTFHGPVRRGRAADWYERGDVFVLPTISDGFALTQLEAMAHGLPVIATPNCGAVVTDRVDGFIVPPRDAVALAKVIQHHLTNPDMLRKQKLAAKAKSRQFTLDRLAGHLLDLEDGLRGNLETLKIEKRKAES